MAKTKKRNVFIAYAKEDKAIMEELRQQLVALERSEEIELWYDGEIEAGSDRRAETLAALQRAHFILLIISSQFIASDYCYEFILTNALNRAKEKDAKLVSVIAKSCLWQETALHKIQYLPVDGTPIVSGGWEVKEEPYVQIVKTINAWINGKELEAEIKKSDQRKGEEERSARDHKKALFLLKEGNAFYRQKKYQEALSNFEKVLKIDPQQELAYHNKGQCLKTLGDKDGALAAFELTIAMNANYWRGYFSKGRLLESQGRSTEAMTCYQRAIDCRPPKGEPYFQLGYLLHVAKRYDEAILYYDKCLLWDSSFYMAYLNKGVLLKKQGDIQGAIEMYRQGIQVNRSYPALFFNLGNAYYIQKKYQLALKNYDIALQLNPNHQKAKDQRAATLKRL